MMREDLREAINSASTVEPDRFHMFPAKRHRGAQATRAIVLAVLQELPSELTVGEIVDELQIAENQRSG